MKKKNNSVIILAIILAVLILIVSFIAFVVGVVAVFFINSVHIEDSGSNEQNSSDIFCTQEVMQCSDGSFVSRNSSRNCEFNPCP